MSRGFPMVVSTTDAVVPTDIRPMDFRSCIYTVRGVQVMLDRDLASAYHVSTAAFNQAVKRNLNRFPEGFRFQLTKDEHSVLMSQIVISKRESGQETRGGYHKLPYAFTASWRNRTLRPLRSSAENSPRRFAASAMTVSSLPIRRKSTGLAHL